ncbi:MAG: major facilitator superfamily transporter [Chloroflexi bacterium ADurb.Bin120]|uniref:Putative Major Facilitator Superfamily n=1 Tax=Candidatus Brevifilum fermentans TaxID=1986204 RepID=A0A1Y6K0B5_9CHLR|nr:MFS transporter [Brevefilum fermentans]OQB85384.1 MAG: major facilitator superfamily transporter [Chloroflexi bacterium ADurb.Bin120]SMX53081.1 putative Major Facilitator Superfamily [Brevefilum fermentans]
MKSQQRPPHNPEGVVRTYIKRVRAFSPNARIYLISIIIYGAGFGIHRILFNFFLRSLGYDETFMGLLSTVNSMTVLISALPMGYLADRLGRKSTLVLAVLLTGASIIFMVGFPSTGILIVTNILMGIGSSLGAVVSGPFMMENSGEEERTYLFSMQSGLQMAANSAGDWLGGYLPSWFGKIFNVSPVSSTAYAWAIGMAGALVISTVIPRLALRGDKEIHESRAAFAPIAFGRKHPGLLAKLLLPMFVTSIGAGLIMPFMNIFFSNVHQQPDPVIGALMAWGSLAMGVGLILAPAFADRYGKIRVVVFSQAISIPFLIILGFSPMFWMSAGAYFVRLTLMNMSTPVYQTFVMEQVEADSRAMVASLNSMVNSFGRAFSPVLSGWMQVNYGFGPPFTGTIITYIIAIGMYYAFFLRGKKRAV